MLRLALITVVAAEKVSELLIVTKRILTEGTHGGTVALDRLFHPDVNHCRADGLSQPAEILRNHSNRRIWGCLHCRKTGAQHEPYHQ